MRIFKEEQRFTQPWIIIIVIISMGISIGMILHEMIKSSTSLTGLQLLKIVTVILVGTGVIFIFKLTTRIDEKGIHYKFFPFHWSYKILTWDTIRSAYVRTYNPVLEYGGWGLKGGALWNKSKGTAINVSGDIGIQLELKSGKKLLIGTQKKAEAESVLETYKIKIQQNENI